MIPQPPPGQGPVDPRNAYAPQQPPQAPFPQQQQQAPMMQQQQQPMPPGMYPPPGMYGPPMPPPPGFMPPMPPMFGPPPRRSGGGAGKTIALILVVVLLLASVLVNVLFIGASAVDGAPVSTLVLREPVEQGSGGDDKIAVVPVVGIIDENMSKVFDAYLDAAERDTHVKAVVIEIDSPGGTVTASDEMYSRLIRFKQTKKVPVVVSMGSLATSGGYYAACASDHIFAQETTLTGNIGVLMPRFNVHKLMDKWGVEENTIVSEGATYKNAGSTFSPETPEETKYLQSIADSMFKRFKDVVVAGRGAKLTSLNLKIEQVADGRAFTATEAKTKGLVDDIGYLHDAIAHAASKAGLSNPPVFRYGLPQPGLMTVLFGANGASLPAVGAQGNARVLINNGVNVNLDRKLLEELAAPRVLYLWRGQ